MTKLQVDGKPVGNASARASMHACTHVHTYAQVRTTGNILPLTSSVEAQKLQHRQKIIKHIRMVRTCASH